MNVGIALLRVPSTRYADEGVDDLEVTISSGPSTFCTRVGVGDPDLDAMLETLATFRGETRGQRCELKVGARRQGDGILHARVSVGDGGRLRVVVRAQCEPLVVADEIVTSQATLAFESEAALLERFAEELTALRARTVDRAVLERSEA